MEQKALLITSMQKLIKQHIRGRRHIGTNKKNQQDIFNSLSGVDLNKIVSNLEDVSADLRKISFQLLGSLLFDNYIMKKTFCNKLGVGQMTGRIVLNPKMLSTVSLGLADLLRLFKQPLTLLQSTFTLWYVNLASFPRKLQYINQTNKNIDPKQCIVGIVYPQSSLELLKAESPMTNNFLSQATSPNQACKVRSHVPFISSVIYEPVFNIQRGREQINYGNSYTANTINNFNTHNNYYTIATPTESISYKNKSTSLRQDKDHKYSKEGPISIKKLNAANYNRGMNQSYNLANYSNNNNSSNYQINNSMQLGHQQINGVNRSVMATSSISPANLPTMSSNSGSVFLNSKDDFYTNERGQSTIFNSNKPMSVISVMVRESEGPYKQEVIKQRTSQPHHQVPQLDIKNRFLVSPAQSVTDRDQKTFVNSYKYYKRY